MPDRSPSPPMQQRDLVDIARELRALEAEAEAGGHGTLAYLIMLAAREAEITAAAAGDAQPVTVKSPGR